VAAGHSGIYVCLGSSCDTKDGLRYHRSRGWGGEYRCARKTSHLRSDRTSRGLRGGHPFIDGNGRVGRLLVVLLLAEWGLVPDPLLDLAAYLEPRRDEYYARLLAVSTDGDWTGWMTFFLDAVQHQAVDAVARAQRLQQLRDDYRSRVATARSSALLGVLVDALFETPAITIARAMTALDVTHRAARLNVDKLVEVGVLTEVGARSRSKLFLAADLLRVVEGLPIRTDTSTEPRKARSDSRGGSGSP
jgi:hypothetical protein